MATRTLGNNYGIGDLRKKELTGSCAALRIDPARCIALDHPALQDNPTLWWDTALVQTIVHDYIAKWDIDAVRCFLSLFSNHAQQSSNQNIVFRF